MNLFCRLVIVQWMRIMLNGKTYLNGWRRREVERAMNPVDHLHHDLGRGLDSDLDTDSYPHRVNLHCRRQLR